MSFAQEQSGLAERLLRLVDAGVAVSAAASALGVPPGRAYTMLRRAGRPAGKAETSITELHREQVLAGFVARGSVAAAARAAGLSHSAARRILTGAGLVAAEPAPRGRPVDRARFFERLAQGRSCDANARLETSAERLRDLLTTT